MEPYRENNIKLSKINVQELFVLVSTFTEPPTIPPSREMANKLFGRPKTDWARVEPKLIQAFGELKPADLCDRWREAALKTIARTCNVHPRFDTEEDGRLAMTFTLVAKDKPLAAMSREEKELWQSRHLVNQPLEAFLSLSLDAAIELTENVPEQPVATAIDAEREGPTEPNNWIDGSGKKIETFLPPKAYMLLKTVWGGTNKTASFDLIYKEVFDDALTEVSSILNHQKLVRKFLKPLDYTIKTDSKQCHCFIKSISQLQ